MNNSSKSNLIFHKFIFNVFDQNTYVVYNQFSKEAWVFDPGNSNEIENDEIERFILENELNLTKILNTHGHIDHVFGVNFLKEIFNPQFLFPSLDLPLIKNINLQAEVVGLPAPKIPNVDLDIHEFEELKFGNETVKILRTPGHSPGGTCYYFVNSKKIITGDTLFFEAIGRTDLWGGNEIELLKSIEENILKLDDEIEILPGHGPVSTIYHEKINNPFLQNF